MNRGKTLEQCKAIKFSLESGVPVFIAGQKTNPQKYINLLASLGCLVEAEPEYTTPNLEPLYQTDGYDTYVYEWYQPEEEELTGYKIKLKQ